MTSVGTLLAAAAVAEGKEVSFQVDIFRLNQVNLTDVLLVISTLIW